MDQDRNQRASGCLESFVIRSVPGALEELVHKRKEELLARTETVRTAVERYLGLVDRRLTPAQVLDVLTVGASEEELREARLHARTVGLIKLPERAWYDAIAVLLVRKVEEVEGDKQIVWGKSHEYCPELDWRFQLLASRLYPERGWELMEGH